MSGNVAQKFVSLNLYRTNLRSNILSPLIGGPGSALTLGIESEIDSSLSIGERPWAADIEGIRNRAFWRQIDANSNVGAGIAALLHKIIKCTELHTLS